MKKTIITALSHLLHISRVRCPQIGRIYLILSLMLAGQLFFTATGYAQTADSKITFELKNQSLEYGLNELGKLSNLRVAFALPQVAKYDNITIKKGTRTVKETLNLLLQNTSLTFVVKDRNLVVVEKASLKTTTSDRKKIVTTGIVTDSNNEFIPGVTVRVKGTNNGTITNSQGEFKIEVGNDDVLSLTSIGYATKEVAVNDQSTIHVSMADDFTALKEVSVVSTGYQTIPKERATGSFAVLDSALINRSASPNLLSRINGLASGVYMSAMTNQTNYSTQGRTTSYMIRGLSTINSEQSPLIIVDGFPFQSTSPYYQDVNSINPDDVESIVVLKDAAAASIWGARAGNGVIVITTKKGKYNQKPIVSFNIGLSVTPKPDLFSNRSMSTSDIIDVENNLFGQGYYDAYNNSMLNFSSMKPVSEVVGLMTAVKNGTMTQQEANTRIAALSKIDVRNDILKNFYQTAIGQKYNVNVRGGTDKYKYYLSAGHENNQGVSFDYQKRTSINVTNSFAPIKNLEISLPIAYSNNATGTNRGSYGSFSPYTQLTDASGNSQNVIYGGGYSEQLIQKATTAGMYDMHFNPIEQFNASQFEHNVTTMLTLNPSIKYTLPMGLSAELTYHYSKTSTSNEKYLSDNVWSIKNLVNMFTQIGYDGSVSYPVNKGGTLNERIDEQTDMSLRAVIGYNHKFGSDHQVDAIAGYERSETNINSNYNGWYGYNSNLGILQSTVDNNSYYDNPYYSTLLDETVPYSSQIPTIQNGVTRQYTAFISYFSNASYTYKNRYTISGSARTDMANLFGVKANNKRKVLWSTGGSWRVDQESFYNVNWLPRLKLRATIGYQGNVPSFNVQSLATITYQSSETNSSGLPYAVLNNLPNPNLRWEQTRQINLALDFGLKNEIINGSIEYYTKKGTDLIGVYSVDPTTGTKMKTGNVASMKGNGIDVLLNSKNINSKNFKWNTRLLFSHNTDEVTDYFLSNSFFQLASYSMPYLVGKPVNSLYSYKWAGLDPLTGDPRGYDADGNISTDYSQILNNTTKENIVYNGSATPTIFGSVMNNFSYKGFNISANITYEAGFYIRVPSISYYNLFGTNMVTSTGDIDYAKRWQKPGDEAFTNVPSMPTVASNSNDRDNFYKYSSALVAKGDNIRLQDISLSYNIENSKIIKSIFSSFQIYTYYLSNLRLWRATQYKEERPAQSISFGIRATIK